MFPITPLWVRPIYLLINGPPADPDGGSPMGDPPWGIPHGGSHIFRSGPKEDPANIDHEVELSLPHTLNGLDLELRLGVALPLPHPKNIQIDV